MGTPRMPVTFPVWIAAPAEAWLNPSLVASSDKDQGRRVCAGTLGYRLRNRGWGGTKR